LTQKSGFFFDRATSRKFPDVRWKKISSLLRRELAAGRSPEQIKQIEFVGETLDMASVLQGKRKILAAGLYRQKASLLGNPVLAFVLCATSVQGSK
jgi:hypothetical protein